jgi:UDP:flavonoid glycosyltransferase YjiC (YdhE family)
MAAQSGLEAFKSTMSTIAKCVQIILRDLPDAIDELKVDALLVDEVVYWGGATVAEIKNIPFGTVANAMNIMHCTDGPPFLTTWQYSGSTLYRLRDSIAWYLLSWLPSSPRLAANAWREQQGLPIIPPGTLRNGGHIQLAQQPAFFEFPKSDNVLPKHFFYTTPWHRLDRDVDIPFPFERLNPSKKLIYASLGTVQNNLLHVYHNICKACLDMEDVQLVIALGKEGASIDIPESELPSECIIVGFCPQMNILRKASLVITHCGMNTCLETLACGLPAVAIPVTNDQPGVAARWQSLGAVKVVSHVNYATASRIREYIDDILPDLSLYREAAKVLQTRLEKEAPTLDEAAALVEIAFSSQDPLTRDDPRVREVMGTKQVEPPLQVD